MVGIPIYDGRIESTLKWEKAGFASPECAVQKVLNAPTHNSAREGAAGRYRNHDRHWWQLAGCEDAREQGGDTANTLV